LSGGLNYLFGTPNNNLVAVIIVASVTAMFLISATTGVEKGVAKLADRGSPQRTDGDQDDSAVPRGIRPSSSVMTLTACA
jgi:hypothetical protein